MTMVPSSAIRSGCWHCQAPLPAWPPHAAACRILASHTPCHARLQSCHVLQHTVCQHSSIHRPKRRQAQRQLRAASSSVPAQQHSAQDPATQQGTQQLHLTGQETPEQLLALLQSAIPGTTYSSDSCAAIQAAITPSSMAGMPVRQLAELLRAVSISCTDLSPTWLDSVLAASQSHITTTLTEDDTPQLAALLWAVSELGCTPPTSWFAAVSGQLMCSLQAGSFLATDLATSVCALGNLGYQPNQATTAALVKEIQLQVSEFLADFQAQDVGRLASGIADLHISAAFPGEFREQLMKAVYSKVWSIEDKAAVDFALAKMNSDDKSMHYDPRWTHEELRWLPRRERDKRRIMKETWQRSQWGGWNS